MRRILGSTAAVGGAIAALMFTAGPALAAPGVTVSPPSGLSNGSTVSVSATGFPASSSFFVVECNSKAATDPGTVHCDLGNVVPLTTDSSGAGKATFTVKTGAIGDGTCAAGGQCLIAVGPASGSNTTNTGGAPISFAAASTGGSTTGGSTTGGTTTGGTTAGGTTSGGTVAGGTSTSTGKPFGLELGLGAALIAAGLGAGGFALRRRVNA